MFVFGPELFKCNSKLSLCPSSFTLRKPFNFCLSQFLKKKVKFDGARCPFSTFCESPRWSPLRMRTKVMSFSYFSKSFQTKKIKALRPKMTKITSRGSCLKLYKGLCAWGWGHKRPPPPPWEEECRLQPALFAVQLSRWLQKLKQNLRKV